MVKGVRKAFIIGLRSGAAKRLLLAASGLFFLYIAIKIFRPCYGDVWERFFKPTLKRQLIISIVLMIMEILIDS
ncbi:hypothetical protein I3842_16G111900 [Carya illinoinensis]|uniref:Uncharacterized protein n=1 Tax=Carya illinoinensis TaxID=32201 RepID=A0A922A225_CARIL|nr:hypothetical protein I3842_16G111900 [Carya illinoinensis]